MSLHVNTKILEMQDYYLPCQLLAHSHPVTMRSHSIALPMSCHAIARAMVNGHALDTGHAIDITIVHAMTYAAKDMPITSTSNAHAMGGGGSGLREKGGGGGL